MKGNIVFKWALIYYICLSTTTNVFCQNDSVAPRSLAPLIKNVDTYSYNKSTREAAEPDILYVTVVKVEAPAEYDVLLYFYRMFCGGHPMLMYEGDISISRPEVFDIKYLCTLVYAGKTKILVFEDTQKRDLEYYINKTVVFPINKGSTNIFPVMEALSVESDIILIPNTTLEK